MTEREVEARNPVKYPTMHRTAPSPSPTKTDLAQHGNKAKVRQTPCARGNEGLRYGGWEELNVWELKEADSPEEAEIGPFPSNLKGLETSEQGGVFLTEYFTSESDDSIKLLLKIVVFSNGCLKL